MSTQNTAIAIFAGGQSTRMGRDKAQLLWRGTSLLQHMCATALSVTNRVLVVGREQPHDWPLENVVFLPDETPHLGPLGGLQTALHWARCEKVENVLALACDLPLIDEAALCWLLGEAQNRELFHGLVSTHDGELEPLFSIYTVACLPVLHHQMSLNRRALHGLIQSGDFETVEVPPEIVAKLVNINTPEDWAQIQN